MVLYIQLQQHLLNVKNKPNNLIKEIVLPILRFRCLSNILSQGCQPTWKSGKSGKSQGIKFVSNSDGKVRAFSIFDQNSGKTGESQGKMFVAMITFNNMFSIVYFNFYYL